MGCSQAILVSDPGLSQADSLATARTLKAAIEKISEVDLVVFGRQAIDTDMGITSVQTARSLGWPSLTLVSTIQTIDPLRVRLRWAQHGRGRQKVAGHLPAVVSVVKDIAEPLSFLLGIRKASRAVIPVWTLADLSLDAPEKRVSWPEVVEPPRREVTIEIITGSSPEEIAEALVEKILTEGVL
jgi:electron transfer flavoprotein beta subunit